ncbi:MAG: hypothetical protein ACYC3I_10395 [Gemmataceae bacterium]
MTSLRQLCRTTAALAAAVSLVAAGCQWTPPGPRAEKGLPPAYLRNQINDPALRKVADEIQTWASRQAGVGGQPLYSRAEVLPLTQTVQPYGVGAYQQEPRLPVILTTGPGWAGLQPTEKEAKTTQAFTELSARLQTLARQPSLRPTLTLQTPQGMELAWINHLDPSGKILHGDE